MVAFSYAQAFWCRMVLDGHGIASLFRRFSVRHRNVHGHRVEATWIALPSCCHAMVMIGRIEPDGHMSTLAPIASILAVGHAVPTCQESDIGVGVRSTPPRLAGACEFIVQAQALLTMHLAILVKLHSKMKGLAMSN